MLAVNGLGDQFGLGKNHIRPATALLVETQDFCRELRTVHYLEIDQAGFIGKKLLVDCSSIHASGIKPDSDLGLRRR